ncbi:TetR family transcriptional regulator [Amycolatopsis sp. NBC_00345]|uniref:TetR family transcriptional regulator n=1 Tax=Amycolatopsis sp. NBC_00345 TaxID=2975955 RepID=UPI002E275D21
MRADAARNIEKVLSTGARLLAQDPTTTIAAIAAAAEVDRRTVYRRFESREALLAAVYEARLDAVEAAIREARLTEAPVAVALHRYAEGIIRVNRDWPVELQRMRADLTIRDRRAEFSAQVAAFVQRATDEGLFRDDLPEGWVDSLLRNIVHLASLEFPGIEPAQAADFAVESLLRGAGRE